MLSATARRAASNPSENHTVKLPRKANQGAKYVRPISESGLGFFG